MIRTNFYAQEQNFGFLEDSRRQFPSLHELFPPSSSHTPSWDLSRRNIQPSELETTTPLRNRYFQKIKPGNQDQCDGRFYISLAEDYCDALTDLIEDTNIAFSKERLGDFLTGGTCSAMAFQFADDYLRRKPFSSADTIIAEISDKYKRSSETFRTIQAAFNTLHRDANYPSHDFTKDKIAAMLRFYDRYVTHASEMFYLETGVPEEAKAAWETIESFMNQFQEGVFVVRGILIDNNDKGEAYGHSTLLIRTKEQSYFYDPDEGIYKLTKGLETEALFQLLKSMMPKVVVPFGRIYKIR